MEKISSACLNICLRHQQQFPSVPVVLPRPRLSLRGFGVSSRRASLVVCRYWMISLHPPYTAHSQQPHLPTSHTRRGEPRGLVPSACSPVHLHRQFSTASTTLPFASPSTCFFTVRTPPTSLSLSLTACPAFFYSSTNACRLFLSIVGFWLLISL